MHISRLTIPTYVVAQHCGFHYGLSHTSIETLSLGIPKPSLGYILNHRNTGMPRAFGFDGDSAYYESLEASVRASEAKKREEKANAEKERRASLGLPDEGTW